MSRSLLRPKAIGRALWPVPGVCRGLPGQFREPSTSGRAVDSIMHSSAPWRNAYWSLRKGAQVPPGFPFTVCLPHCPCQRHSLIPGADMLWVGGGLFPAISQGSLELALNMAWVPGRGGRRLASPPCCTVGRKSPFFQGALTFST